MSRKNKEIIFDFDGTIADSLPLIYKTSNDILIEKNKKELSPEDIERLKEKGVRSALKELNFSIFKFPFLILKIQLEVYNNIDKVDVFSGMDIVLNNLSKDFKLGILTNNRKKTVHRFLKQEGLDFFDFVDDNLLLRDKSKKLKKLATSGIYIGDQVADMRAAKKADLLAIGVTWGVDKKVDLDKAGADIVVDRPEEIYAYVKGLD